MRDPGPVCLRPDAHTSHHSIKVIAPEKAEGHTQLCAPTLCLWSGIRTNFRRPTWRLTPRTQSCLRFLACPLLPDTMSRVFFFLRGRSLCAHSSLYFRHLLPQMHLLTAILLGLGLVSSVRAWKCGIGPFSGAVSFAIAFPADVPGMCIQLRYYDV